MVPNIIKLISKLPEKEQFAITEKFNATYIGDIWLWLDVIASLTKDVQSKIYKNYNINIPAELVGISQFHFSEQIAMLAKFKNNDFAVKYQTRLVKKAIAALDDKCPMEHFIKSRLQSMWINAEPKQIAVLTALESIKSKNNPQDTTAIIQQALANPHVN